MSDFIHVGIDIAKQHLDVATSNSTASHHFTNDSAGFEKLAKLLPTPEHAQIVLESTGSYHLDLVTCVAEMNYRVTIVTPGRVRAFAAAMGILAKTDQIGALVLVKFSQHVEDLRFTQTPSENQQKLHGLVTRRRQRVAVQCHEKNQLEAVCEAMSRADISDSLNDLRKRFEAINQQADR